MKEHEPTNQTGRDPVPYPAITFGDGQARLLSTAYRALGEPNAVRCYTNENLLGIEPCEPGERSAYIVGTPDDSGGKFSAGWLKYELGLEDDLRGRVPLEYGHEVEMWVADLQPLIEDSMGYDRTVDDAKHALRMVAEYCQSRDCPDIARDAGEVYDALDSIEDRLRREDRKHTDREGR